MLPFLDSFALWALATFLPALAGISLLVLIGGVVGVRYSSALALGVFFWFFVDTIQGSSNLLVNAGFTGGYNQFAVVLLFAVGVLFFLGSDRRLFDPSSGLTLAIPFLVAVAVGIHGFGEGSAFGSTAAQTSSTSILDAFGGVTAAVAYALHKMLEPFMVAAVYLAYSAATPRPTMKSTSEVVGLTFAFTIPSLLGAATGYFFSYDATYFFALGTGTSVYAAFRLGRHVFAGSSTGSGASLKVAGALILGFLLIYVAALFHS